MMILTIQTKCFCKVQYKQLKNERQIYMTKNSYKCELNNQTWTVFPISYLALQKGVLA